MGGERHRHAAPGPDAGATADPRSLRGHARGARRHVTGSSSPTSPTTRSTPGSSWRPTAADVEIDSRPSDALALAVRAGVRSTRPRRSCRAPAVGARGPIATSAEMTGEPRADGERSSIHAWTSSATSSTRSRSTRRESSRGCGVGLPAQALRPVGGWQAAVVPGGRPRRRARGRFAHIAGAGARSRLTARRRPRGLAPVAEPAVRG